MSSERLLIDTVFVQAFLNRRDQYHQQALKIMPRVEAAQEVWVTSAILTEVADGLSLTNRMNAVGFIQRCYRTANIHVIFVDFPLFTQSVELYQSRRDKEWGLTDRISFVFMRERGIFSKIRGKFPNTPIAQAGFVPEQQL
ncbi:MAG: nucleic acid-binding protein [Chloroflexota bacterium]|nr:nucleic acid-binding protein [Chloroflexota bacterium]